MICKILQISKIFVSSKTQLPCLDKFNLCDWLLFWARSVSIYGIDNTEAPAQFMEVSLSAVWLEYQPDLLHWNLTLQFSRDFPNHKIRCYTEFPTGLMQMSFYCLFVKQSLKKKCQQDPSAKIIWLRESIHYYCCTFTHLTVNVVLYRCSN